MTFWISVGIILLASFLWALFNLQGEFSKTKHLEKLYTHKKKSAEKHKLDKEKVLFEK